MAPVPPLAPLDLAGATDWPTVGKRMLARHVDDAESYALSATHHACLVEWIKAGESRP